MSALSLGPGNLQARLQNGIWWDQAPDSVHLNKLGWLAPHNVPSSPDDRLAHEDEAVAAGQADGGAHRVVPAGHEAPVYWGLRHLTPVNE